MLATNTLESRNFRPVVKLKLQGRRIKKAMIKCSMCQFASETPTGNASDTCEFVIDGVGIYCNMKSKVQQLRKLQDMPLHGRIL